MRFAAKIATRTVLLLFLLSGCAAQVAQTSADPIKLRKQLARSLMAYREWGQAAQPLRELAKLAPADPEIRTLLAHSYREQGLYNEAEDEYRSALKIDDKYAEAHAGLGILFDLRGDKDDKSVSALRRAIDLSPDQAAYHNNLGFAFYVRGRYPDAETAYREALRRDPTQSRIRNNLGFVYAKMGDFHRAQREFERGGTRANAENNLGFAFEQAGQTLAACESYREAERLDPHLEIASHNANRVCVGGSLKPQFEKPQIENSSGANHEN